MTPKILHLGSMTKFSTMALWIATQSFCLADTPAVQHWQIFLKALRRRQQKIKPVEKGLKEIRYTSRYSQQNQSNVQYKMSWMIVFQKKWPGSKILKVHSTKEEKLLSATRVVEIVKCVWSSIMTIRVDEWLVNDEKESHQMNLSRRFQHTGPRFLYQPC